MAMEGRLDSGRCVAEGLGFTNVYMPLLFILRKNRGVSSGNGVDRTDSDNIHNSQAFTGYPCSYHGQFGYILYDAPSAG